MDSNPQSDLDRWRPRGFSLVELLVVISILALLIALLLPTLEAAKDQGRATVCLSGLRQIGLGVTTYVNESRTWWPDGSGWTFDPSVYPHTPSWARVVAKTIGVTYVTEQYNVLDYAPEQYLGFTASLASYKNNGIFQCPGESALNAWGGKNATSYLHNSGAGYRNGFGISDSYLVHPTSAFADYWAPIREGKLIRPSATFFIGESDWVISGWWFEYNNNQFYDATIAGTWHGGGGNYLWADGHAGFLRADRLKPADFDRGP